MHAFRCGCDGATARPFFMQVPIDRPEPLPEPLADVPDCLPDVVRELYATYGRNYEWYIDDLTIPSLRFVEESRHPRFMDFAFRYAGMGHVEVYFVDKETKRAYRRTDGGANGFERKDNHQRHLAYTPCPDDEVDLARLLAPEPPPRAVTGGGEASGGCEEAA